MLGATLLEALMSKRSIRNTLNDQETNSIPSLYIQKESLKNHSFTIYTKYILKR